MLHMLHRLYMSHMSHMMDNLRARVRWHKLYMADEKGLIPPHWDLTVDCGFSDKWYRCDTCDTCLGFFG